MAGLKVKDEYQGLTEAVSLGIAVLKKTRHNTWAELMAAMASGDAFTVKTLKALDLSAAQLAVMDRFTPVISLVTIKPSTVPAVCPGCGLYILTADTAPTRCLVTAGCAGKPFKVAAATAGPSPDAEDMLPADFIPERPSTPAAEAAPSAEEAGDKNSETAAEADPVEGWVPQLDGPEDDAAEAAEFTAAEPELTVTVEDLESLADFDDFDDLDVPQAKGPRPRLNLDEDPFA
jgi:hypothetical protein